MTATAEDFLKAAGIGPEPGNAGPPPPPKAGDEMPETDGVPNGFKRTYEQRRAARWADRKLDEEEWQLARGEQPITTAREFVKEPKPRVVLEPYLAVGPNGLGGPSDAGKSLLARDWAIFVAAQGRNVLVVLGEGSPDFEERWTTHPQWEAAADHIYVIDGSVDLVKGNGVDDLIQKYKQYDIVLVVFDLIYDMGMADDNGVKDVLPVFAAMKKIAKELNPAGAAVLAVGHTPHETKGRRFRGSSMWRQLFVTEYHMADNQFTCEKSKIADKRKYTRQYLLEYPAIKWLTGSEVVKEEDRRKKLIEEDFDKYPKESDNQRAKRLMDVLGLKLSAARDRIRKVREERDDVPSVV